MMVAMLLWLLLLLSSLVVILFVRTTCAHDNSVRRNGLEAEWRAEGLRPKSVSVVWVLDDIF